MDDFMAGFLIWTALVCLYMLPSIVGVERHHPSVGGICVINLFFGWTLLGWVIALAWSLSAVKT